VRVRLQAWLRLAVYNGSITMLEVRADGGVSLRALGDTAHFDAKVQALPPSLSLQALSHLAHLTIICSLAAALVGHYVQPQSLTYPGCDKLHF